MNKYVSSMKKLLPTTRGLFFLLLLFAGLSVSLTACGKRPGHVDAPDGANANAFPRVYPDLSLDERPSFSESSSLPHAEPLQPPADLVPNK